MNLLRSVVLLAGTVSPVLLGADLVLLPSTPYAFGETTPGSTQSTFAPGFQYGAWKASVPAPGQKHQLFLPAGDLFPGQTVLIDDIASISFWTNKPGTTADVDWFLAIYTQKTGVGDTGSFYHSRLNSETAYTQTPVASVPPNTWHRWSTDDPNFPLRFFDSNRNGGIFGTSAPPDPTLATLQAGPFTWPASNVQNDYGPEAVAFFTLQTGSCCTFGFSGLVDGLTITLKNGMVSRVNLEAVLVADSPYLVRYASNLTAGDSVINMSNSGANGASLTGPGFGSAAGNICVNAYAFSPDEQLVSCCSCLITPNGLISLSVREDLLSNTLTGVRPDAAVIKLVATGAGAAFTGTACTNSAALASTPAFPLAGGLLAFGTTIHAAPGGGFATSETPFLSGTLSPEELASLTNRCANIVGNGSTFGVCRSCRNGGLASTAR